MAYNRRQLAVDKVHKNAYTKVAMVLMVLAFRYFGKYRGKSYFMLQCINDFVNICSCSPITDVPHEA